MNKHWTDECSENFVYFLTQQFVDSLQHVMDEENIQAKDLARKLKLSQSRVSQILNDPGNLTLDLIVRCATALRLKVALITYEDDENNNNPIINDVFLRCWELYGKPKTVFDLPVVPKTEELSYLVVHYEEYATPNYEISNAHAPWLSEVLECQTTK